MKKEIIINATSSEIRVALLENGKLAELFLELPDKERHVGSIFLGRVERVVQGMNAAFVDIGHEQDAFLHFSDAANAGEDFKDLVGDDDDDDDDIDSTTEKKEGEKEKRGERREERNGRAAKDSRAKGPRDGKGPREKGQPAGKEPGAKTEGEKNEREGKEPRGKGPRDRKEQEDRKRPEGKEGRGRDQRRPGEPKEKQAGAGEAHDAAGEVESREGAREQKGRPDRGPRRGKETREGALEGTREGRGPREGRDEKSPDGRKSPEGKESTERGPRDRQERPDRERREGDRRDGGRPDRDRAEASKDRRPEARDKTRREEERRSTPSDATDDPGYDNVLAEDLEMEAGVGTEEPTLTDAEGNPLADDQPRKKKRRRRGGRRKKKRREGAEGVEGQSGEAQSGEAQEGEGQGAEGQSGEAAEGVASGGRREGQPRRDDRRRDESRRDEPRADEPVRDRDRNRETRGDDATAETGRPAPRRDERREPHEDRGARPERGDRNDRRGGRPDRRDERPKQESDRPVAGETGERETPQPRGPVRSEQTGAEDKEASESRREPRDRNRGRNDRRRDEATGAGEPTIEGAPVAGEASAPADQPAEEKRRARPDSRRPSRPERAPRSQRGEGETAAEPTPPKPEVSAAPVSVASPEEAASATPAKRTPAKRSSAKASTKKASRKESPGEVAQAPVAEGSESPEPKPKAKAKPKPRAKKGDAPATPSVTDSATGSEAEAPKSVPAKASKKTSTKRPPRSSKGGAGGKVMDAELPTFQTKKHGEVTIQLEKGQEVLVQVIRESYASKGVKVSTKITLPGRFMVLLPLEPFVGISKKIMNVKERRRLRGIARKLLPEGFGCIIRTVAQEQESELLERELQTLLDRWRGIEEKLKTAKGPTLLYQEQSIAGTVMRDLLTSEIGRVVIDNKKLYEEIYDYVSWAAPGIRNKVEHFNGKRPIFQEYGVEKELDQMLASKVWLSTGGYIILEQTEAMMVIDVNSGRYAKDREQEMNSLKTNLEAAREIARQVRLRDIGGLLVVDFIDLYDEKNRKKVYDEIKKEMSRDRAKSVILPMTQFGLVQMTRQRVRQQLVDSLSEPCPTCAGKGIVQSKSTIARRIDRWLASFRAQAREFRLNLSANPYIIEYLNEGDNMSRLTKLMLRHFVRIKVIPDESLGLEQFRFWSVRRQEDVTDEYMPK